MVTMLTSKVSGCAAHRCRRPAPGADRPPGSGHQVPTSPGAGRSSSWPSAGGNSVKVIADMAQTSPGPGARGDPRLQRGRPGLPGPQVGRGRPRIIDAEDRALIVKVAKKRPRSLGRPFTRWSIRKLQKYLAIKKGRKVEVSRERLRQISTRRRSPSRRTKTWKESPDPCASRSVPASKRS